VLVYALLREVLKHATKGYRIRSQDVISMRHTFFLLDTTGRFTWRNRFFVKEKRVWASACTLDLCHLYVIAQMGCIGYFYQDPEYISKKEDRLKSFIERKQRWWAHLYLKYIWKSFLFTSATKILMYTYHIFLSNLFLFKMCSYSRTHANLRCSSRTPTNTRL